MESFLLEIKAEELQSLWLDNCDNLFEDALEINRDDMNVLNETICLQAMSKFSQNLNHNFKNYKKIQNSKSLEIFKKKKCGKMNLISCDSAILKNPNLVLEIEC